MALSSKEVLDVAGKVGRPGINGRVAALIRVHKNSAGQSTLTGAQRDFLTAAAAVPPQPKRATYTHPGTVLPNSRHGRGDKPLTPSELAWLQRLPADPAQVPFDDARRLLTLAKSVSEPDDRLLLDAIAAPVREYHDRKQAEVDVTNARMPLPDPPSQTLPALADAVAAEIKELRPDEVITRASRMLADHRQQQSHQQALARTEAEDRLDRLAAAAADRIAVHR